MFDFKAADYYFVDPAVNYAVLRAGVVEPSCGAEQFGETNNTAYSLILVTDCSKENE